MNLLEKLCKELGVEVGEEWLGSDGKFYSIDASGKLINYEYKEKGRKLYTDFIERVLSGKLKPAWKPEYGQPYYTPNPSYKHEIYRYDRLTYEEDLCDEWCIKNNMAYKTKEEAIEVANKMLEAIKEED